MKWKQLVGLRNVDIALLCFRLPSIRFFFAFSDDAHTLPQKRLAFVRIPMIDRSYVCACMILYVNFIRLKWFNINESWKITHIHSFHPARRISPVALIYCTFHLHAMQHHTELATKWMRPYQFSTSTKACQWLWNRRCSKTRPFFCCTLCTKAEILVGQ